MNDDQRMNYTAECASTGGEEPPPPGTTPALSQLSCFNNHFKEKTTDNFYHLILTLCICFSE